MRRRGRDSISRAAFFEKPRVGVVVLLVLAVFSFFNLILDFFFSFQFGVDEGFFCVVFLSLDRMAKKKKKIVAQDTLADRNQVASQNR